ncbi:UDP-glycosyltransferase 85C2-like [Cynara cardunculus var. scolymus]|uniref:Glycosyltransferase n=1 Tax=Cynara cardunculus var. scolymus TaxID=59895 RepID=A0A103EQS1_CYNCS|nr:UDP-glycosyltransferase 85C2-like [Cynara cardunculus var. scolymus]KVE39115.1 UDP-glucuronosyl/UDP-glucosyltransferase [Cynara cardunculus var. scolymus]
MTETMATAEKKPHVIFIPFPAQSHVKAMLKLAELLHHKGLRITFVNTEFVHKRLLKSAGPHYLSASPDFHLETIPDGIPRTSEDDNDSDLLLHYLETNFLAPFLELATKLPTPPTCIISDGLMSSFPIDAAQTLEIPIMLYWTLSACGFMGLYQIQSLIDKGLTPVQDESYLTNGFLETIIDWIPGMKSIRLKDLPTNVWTTDPNDKGYRFLIQATKNSNKVSNIILHTFDELEDSIVKALSSMFHHVYTIGPVQLLLDQTTEHAETPNVNGYSLWKEEPDCFKWLESKEPNSVIYVNYGSTTVMSLEELIEFGWGLADSNHYFLWILRSNLVVGDQSAVLPPELEEQIKRRGFIASWCSQEKVLNHTSIGGFLTHGGWGSTIESLSAGVPMICWPYLWDQTTNCRFICKEWDVGLEMGKNVKRDEVKKLVQELMGEGGQRMRNKAMEWKEKAKMATSPNGSSFLNVEKLVKEITMLSTK